MGRAPCCEKVGLRRGRWTEEEDQLLSDYIQAHGEGSWRSLPKNAGLLRCGKSCRLRWINYLRSDVKRGNISAEEEDLILKLHAKLGNRWSLIAGQLAGRTDNEIKNYWNSHLSRKISPSSPTVPTKRRSSAVKAKKPRKTTSTVLPLLENPSNTNPSAGGDDDDGGGGGGGEVIPDASTSVGEKEFELDDCFDDEGLIMELTSVSEVLTEQDQEEVVINNNNSASSSTDDSNQGKQDNWEWECEWDFEGVSRMVGLGGEEDNDLIAWPWESESPTQEVGVDLERQEAMIAWLLS